MGWLMRCREKHGCGGPGVGTAAKLYRLNDHDMVEIARNSILISGTFPLHMPPVACKWVSRFMSQTVNYKSGFMVGLFVNGWS